jgi:hypothetical protein
MPFYNTPEATKYLKEFLGDHYVRDDTPAFKALWRNYNLCQFVEDDGQHQTYTPCFFITWRNTSQQVMFFFIATVKDKRSDDQQNKKPRTIDCLDGERAFSFFLDNILGETYGLSMIKAWGTILWSS